ncbi:hypothetical protein [Persicirhabdus sediminis]|uniref:Uncharacterized protein n=1 Tax=Persicirhabdus sediminis TaxID=454144 RepID=A0A8J7MF80_9BACT|nr:hypothetical protein [Persicirhabdus sediminis]MBK1791630.1 hypothetical protein [Persicirhabdus sediminis]
MMLGEDLLKIEALSIWADVPDLITQYHALNPTFAALGNEMALEAIVLPALAKADLSRAYSMAEMLDAIAKIAACKGIR